MGILYIFGIIGAGLALYFNGRSRGSKFKRYTGVTFTVLGILLLALTILAEAKKAGLV